MSDECVEFEGFIHPSGYGWRAYKGKKMFAHRVAMLEAGINIEGWHVLHSCGNKRCVNVEHLHIGTSSATLKLTPDQVQQIRMLLAEGRSQRSIGEQFGVHRNTISAIHNDRSWTHLWEFSE